jgi:UDP-glucuronate decarboxylase
LDFYSDKSIKGFQFFSSSEIYGDPSSDAIPTNEEYRGSVSCTGPRACYDEAKRFGETMCALFARKYGLPIGVVRPFNNYGPGMRLNDHRVSADFAKAVFNNDDLVVLSSGRPTRTYCYVADAVIGYLKVLLHGRYDYFNIGSDAPEISVIRLAEIYREAGQEIFGHKVKIVNGFSDDADYLTHNPERRCPDLAKARKILNYGPMIDVEQGVRRFLWAIFEGAEGFY